MTRKTFGHQNSAVSGESAYYLMKNLTIYTAH